MKSEINIKEIEFIDDSSKILVKQIKPNFKILGPRFGKEIKLITESIKKLENDQIFKLEQNGEIILKINKKNIKLARNEVEITSKDIEGWSVAHSSGITVALDIKLNEKLIYEGIAREFINRIQNYRKDLGFKVTDKIEIFITKNSILNKVISSFKKYIQQETLASSINIVNEKNKGIKLDFDGINISVLIKKINYGKNK